MSGDETNPDFDSAENLEDGELMIDESGEGDGDGDDEGSPAELQQAAQAIDFVALPIACTNEGKGAPLAMGIQRWWAQELAEAGGKAAAPVFTALHEQAGRKVPALMIFREPWTDARALEGIQRFANARHGLVTDMHVQEDQLQVTARMVEVGPSPELLTLESWSFTGTPDELPGKLFDLQQGVAVASASLARPRPGSRPSAPTTSRRSSPIWSASATSARCRAAACRPPRTSCSPR